MDSFLDAIPTSTLPKTFIDAVEVAKYLNVRYLWIDSLCIIQDSEEDWKEQATLMGRVYQEALCNIGATGSTDSHGGLFQDRDPESVHTCYITYGGQMFQLIHNEVWRCGIDEAPLNKRAWVVQERVLCQRMLHFGHDQIFWECNEAVACEMYPNGQTSLIKHENFKEKTTIVRSLRPGFKADIPQHALAHLWAAMVKRYTSSRLTYENDKLVALSGLAKAVQSGLEDEYLAGLWKGGVIRQLLWYTPFTSGEYVYPKDFVAPSWSWASIGGVVQYPSWLGDEADCREIAHLTDYHVELGSSDPTGKVLGGFLRIRGPISKIAVGKDTNIPPQGYILNVSASSIQFDISWGEPPEGLFFLCLTGGKLLKSSKVGGLLLKIDKMKNMMRFKRIGIGSVWDKDWIKNNVEGATDSDTVPDEPGISHICTIDIV
jgi:hypothetical protein